MLEDSTLQRNSLVAQIVQKLIQRIRNGVYPPQSQLPPENTLAAEFAVSRTTIRTAMETLAGQNLVFRRQGVGTFVSALARIRDPLDQAVLFQTMIARNGYMPGVRFLPTMIVEPTIRHLEALRALPSDRLLSLPKIFTADGDPVIYCTNTIAPRLMRNEVLAAAVAEPDITEPIFDFMERMCDVRIMFYAATLRPDLVRAIRLPDDSYPPDTPVLTIDEIAYDSDERPVLHSVHHYPGNRIDFELVRRCQLA